MASWQAHVMSILLRYRVKRALKGSTDIKQIRATLSSGQFPVPANVTFTPEIVAGIPGEWVRAKGSSPHEPKLLYLHGGGYFACSPQTHRPITAAYAKRGFAVYVPDYRLAPEHPFPAAVEDVLAVWKALVARGNAPQAMALSGESAGGGLSLALLLSLRDGGAPGPAAAALFSPWTDLAGTGASVDGNDKRDAMFTAQGVRDGAAIYLAGTPATNPLASPYYADLHGLPPLLFHCGEREIMRDDSVRMVEKAKAAGVSVQSRIWPVVPHAWQLTQHFVPEARQSLDLAAAFLHQALAAAQDSRPKTQNHA